MKTFKIIISLTLILICSSSFACDREDKLRVYYSFFNMETFLPIKIKDIRGDSGGFLMDIGYFYRLILSSSPAKDSDFFENIRMRVKTKKGFYYIDKDGVILFKNKVIGKLDAETRNSFNLGNNLYDKKSCRPLNEILIDSYKKYDENLSKMKKKCIDKEIIKGKKCSNFQYFK